MIAALTLFVVLTLFVLVIHTGAVALRLTGLPAHGNQRSAWDAGCRFDYPNPDYK